MENLNRPTDLPQIGEIDGSSNVSGNGSAVNDFLVIF
jgi:hypothetical protein